MKREEDILLPAIKVYEVDYSFIIKNYLSRSLWDKTWTLFQYKYTTATLCLDKIDTRRKIIIFEVRVDWLDGDKSDYSTSTIEFQLGTMNITQLKSIINNSIWNRIYTIERHLIEQSEEYQRIRDSWRDEKCRLEEIANDFLDSEGVKNEAIRNAYVHKFIDDNDTLWRDLNQYEDDMKYKILTELYLVFAKTIKDEDREKDVINNQITNIQELLDRVAEFVVYLETEEYYEEKQNLLESLS